MKPTPALLPSTRLIQSGSLAVTLPAGLLIALWLVSSAIASLTTAAGHFDDGIQLVGALMVQHGLRPNIDFHAVYPPLNAYLLSAAFTLFGRSIVSYHLFQLTMLWLAVTAVVVGCVLLTGQRRAAALVACIALALNAQLAMLQNASAVAFSMLATVSFLLAGTRQGAARSWISALSGATVAALLWTRPNFALYFLAAWLCDSAARYLDARQAHSAARRQVLLKELGCFVAAAAGCAVLGLLAWGGSPLQLFGQVVSAPSKALVAVAIYPLKGGLSTTGLRELFVSGVLLPLLPLAWLAAASGDARGLFGRKLLGGALIIVALCIAVCATTRPALLPIITLVPIALTATRVLQRRPGERFEAFVLLLISLQAHYVMSRPDGSHYYSTFPLFALLIGLRISESNKPHTAPALLAAAAIGLFPAVYQVHAWLLPALKRSSALETVPALLATHDDALFRPCEGACSYHIADHDELEAARYVRERTGANDAVFAGLQKNADNSVNSIRSYWLMDRVVGTRDLMMIYGITSPKERQRAIAEDLEKNHVNWAILWRGEDESPARDRNPPSPLDEYLRAHFQPKQTFGAYQVWNRR